MSTTRRSGRIQRFVRAATVPVVALAVLLGTAGITFVGVAPPAGAVNGQYWISKLQLAKVWKITRGAGVTVAVVDSGTPPTSVLGNRLLTGFDTIDNTPSGQHDSGESAAGTRFSHGQQMAELVAGDGAGGGIQGIAPAAKILPVRAVTENGGGSDSTIAAGIRYAVSHGASVISLSIGGTGQCTSELAAAVKDAYQHGDIVVVAAGNHATAHIGEPANCAGALAVSGIAPNGSYWSGSSYGPQTDVANFATDVVQGTLDGGFVNGDGTSPATAFTSGEIALLRSAFPHDSARQIITRLLYGIDTLSSVPTGTRVNDHVGYGVPVPLSALKAKVPANAVNPIYDQLAKELGAGSGNTAPGSSTSPSSSPPTTGGTSTGGASPPSVAPGPSASDSASSGGGSGISPLAVVVVVVVVIAVIVGAVAVARSRRRRPPGPPTGYGPPGGYGPPPPGYGPPGS